MGRGQIEQDIEALLDLAHDLRNDHSEQVAPEGMREVREVVGTKVEKTAAEVADGLLRMISEEEKLALIESFKKEGFLPAKPSDIDPEAALGPRWDKPFTWAMASGDTFERGDGLWVKDRVYIVLRRLRFRRRCANILCQDRNDPTRYWRAGTIDYLPRFPNYVHYQQISAWGVNI